MGNDDLSQELKNLIGELQELEKMYAIAAQETHSFNSRRELREKMRTIHLRIAVINKQLNV